jgi:LysM repeat protein
MAAKTPKKFRQARKAARKDAKKIFSGKKQAGLKDKSPLMKFSDDDKKALSEIRKEAREGYITDDRGNKINVKPTETAKERIARDRREAKAELERRWAIEDGKEKVRESKPATKATPRITEAGKVRSAVTATEVKSQGFKIDPKTGKKIKEAKAPAKPGESKAFKSKKTFGQISKEVADKSKAPVAKKGFAAGKELNAEGKAIYDKLVKEGVKPKSALNKALFRQEKGKKPIPKTTSSVKSKIPAGAKPIGSGSFNPKTGKIDFKFDNKQIKSIVEKNKAANAIKVPSTVVSSKPNVPGKELVVRPKAGPVATKAATASAKKKFTAKGAALGAAKFAGKAVTGKAALAVTAGSLLAGPLIKQLTKDKNRVTSADVMKAREQAAVKANTAAQANKSRSNQPRVTGKGKAVGRGSVPTLYSGGSTSIYKVNAGDTLSGIAKKSGVTLSELMAANKNIKDPKKIYRNTSVKIPSKGKLPAGGYTGPVPYRPKKK